MPVRLNRQGAALPWILIGIALMAVSAAIGYYRLASERRTTSSRAARLDAIAAAQSGLSQYLATRTTRPGWTQDTIFTSLPGGAAVVSLRMLRESTREQAAVYVVTSRGYSSDKDHNPLTLSGGVTTYAVWAPTPLAGAPGLTSRSHGGSLQRVRNGWIDARSRY